MKAWILTVIGVLLLGIIMCTGSWSFVEYVAKVEFPRSAGGPVDYIFGGFFTFIAGVVLVMVTKLVHDMITARAIKKYEGMFRK